jgi:hypothetical protein
MVEKTKELTNGTSKDKLFKAQSALVPTGGEWLGHGAIGYLDQAYMGIGLSPEKLIIPREYQAVIKLCYDYYQRGIGVSRVVDRITELAITDIRNGQRKTSDESNAYFEAVLHSRPSRLMRFLRMASLEYFLSGMVLPRVEWVELKGSEISPDLTAGKTYTMPVFDLFPPQLVSIEWAGWGKRRLWLKIPDDDIRTIRNKGGIIKEQQEKYQMWQTTYPQYVAAIESGANRIEITNDTDPIFRKEVSFSPYPTPYIYCILEPLMFKDQLRRMDFAVASRVVNAILLVQVGSDEFPVTEENQDLVDNLKNQLLARTGNPLQMERLFTLFADHTTKLSWIAPDTAALLNQEKYRQVNEELDEGLGFARILLTGNSRGGTASGNEISTWAIQPQMEELRGNLLEWMNDAVYTPASKENKFRNIPVPKFKPIRLQDFVKTAAVFMQGFQEGNISRTTRAETMGLDFETETELMKDEANLMEGLPAFQPTPYSPLPPVMGAGGKPGRPLGSQNVPVNNRNSGVKPAGQKPASRVKAEVELLSDEEVINLMNTIALKRGLYITVNDILPENDE